MINIRKKIKKDTFVMLFKNVSIKERVKIAFKVLMGKKVSLKCDIYKARNG